MAVPNVVSNVVAIIGMLMAGCAAPPPSDSYTLILDNDSLSVQNKIDAVTAVDNWEHILDGKLSVNVVSGHCNNIGSNYWNAILGEDEHTICMQASTSAFITSHGGAIWNIGFTIRWLNSDSANIYLAMDLIDSFDTTQMLQVMQHELGHSFGLHHTVIGTLMFYTIDGASSTITCDDTAQWYDIRGMSNISKSCPDGGTLFYYH